MPISKKDIKQFKKLEVQINDLRQMIEGKYKENIMKLICEGLDLSDAVLKVIRATATKTTNPILEGIKLRASEDSLTLSATDLEISIEKTNDL